MNESGKKKIFIKGPSKLKGKVNISGSKNAVLPILAATLITDKKCIIRNVPDLTDISIMIEMLRVLGKKVKRNGMVVKVEYSGRLGGEAPYDLVKKLRASVLVMGGLAGRRNDIKVALPGGCAIGTRPVDLHLKGFQTMGASIDVSEGFININTKGLQGKTVYLDYPSVGASENLIIAGCRAKGETIIENTAREPEVLQLVEFLKQAGAEIKVKDNTVRIKGKNEFNSVDFKVMDDRIQAGTYILAGCINSSELIIEFSHPKVIESTIEKVIECGAKTSIDSKNIEIKGPSKLKSTDIRTSPYPGFPTDLQAPFTSLLATAKGVSVITEEIFENRFLHCPELRRMGADIEIKGSSAIITGVKKMTGAPVMARDLRGGAALIIAGLLSNGVTEISGIHHIERGYEDIVGKLQKLGADIWIEQ
ncbi:MAG: UDP-N-acetylglucosamine 1-carboxyvinyltransferase [Elusimicrobiota bacterium]